MISIYSCPKCGQVFPEAHQIGRACPKCGQLFQADQVAAIASRTRWTHVLIVTGIVGLLGGMGLGIVAVKQLALKPPTAGYVAIGITAVVTVVVGFLIRAYDNWRNG